MSVLQNPICFSAEAQDLFNYLSGYIGCNHQIHCILRLDGKINEDRLQRAAVLTIMAEPVLACRFVEDSPNSYWEIRDNLDIDKMCSLVETLNVDDEMAKFINAPLDLGDDPLLQLRIFRSGSTDVLVIKINHACCDAGGLKEYIALLASIYNRLSVDLDYLVSPNIEGRRGQSQLFERLGVLDLQKAWDSGRAFSPPAWSFPALGQENLEPAFVVKTIARQQFQKIAAYAQAQGVTINDILLTAFYRALFIINQPKIGEPMNIRVTADLRRYLPGHQAEAICNLSGIVSPAVARIPGERFRNTLLRVSQAMQEWKNSSPGLQTAFISEIFARLGFREFFNWMQEGWQYSLQTKLSAPIFSNIGRISREKIFFGQIEAVSGYIIGPAMSAPSSLLATSTYDDELTLAMAFYKPANSEEAIKDFLNLMVEEICF